MAWSLLVRNGWVIDGSGAPRVRADVAVEGDRIAEVAPNLAGEATRVVDAIRVGDRITSIKIVGP